MNTPPPSQPTHSTRRGWPLVVGILVYAALIGMAWVAEVAFRSFWGLAQ